MKWLFSSLISGSKGREIEPQSSSNYPDVDIEAMGFDETALLTRQLMTLSRRRRCAVNHLGSLDPFCEPALVSTLSRWYKTSFGYKESGSFRAELLETAQSDLLAIASGSSGVSKALRRRVILTDYFSGGKLEDYYGYGKIDPFVFESEGTAFHLRDTLFDRMNFPKRVSTIVSFDPEVRGHRHQIRYFRALLVAYSLAHILEDSHVPDEARVARDLLLNDEISLARGWLTTAEHASQIGIDPASLSPDESLLYSQDKVYESVMLFRGYEALSREKLSDS